MSKDTQQSEEVDLGQLFKMISNMFDKLFKFIGSILNRLFLAFVWLVFFIKKHFIKLVIAGTLGTGLSVLLEKTSDPVYKSYVTIKQNYNTGENLYNSIIYYNDLVKQGDVGTLETVLEIKPEEAASILDFNMESVISKNQKLQEYDKYLKTLDTTVAKTVEYKTFLGNSEDYHHQYQQITIKAKERNNFKTVFDKIIANINSNAYFKREQEKDLRELKDQALAISEALIMSDTLLDVYQKAIVKSAENDNEFQSKIKISSNMEETSSTKEFELYNKSIELKQELVDIEREIADKEHIIEITSSKQDSGSIDNKKELLGISVSGKVFYGIIFTGLTFFVLLGLQFIKYLEQFKDKV
ncbi:hypothetical protein [Seonamhaeicola sp.]|uniref:hypothetical protein n=1 Tax=Seonamhaeicola sp. TaxID=1912245 RepID=UPI00261D4882|nr:hypothetical protein [Seonamhaeicola sp.]